MSLIGEGRKRRWYYRRRSRSDSCIRCPFRCDSSAASSRKCSGGSTRIAVFRSPRVSLLRRCLRSCPLAPSRPRPVARRILIYWATITLGPILIGASLSITSYLVGVSLGFARQTPLAGTAILRLAPFVLTCAAFTLLYYVVPNRSVRPHHALIGGLVAGLAFEIMKRSFALYIAKFPTYTLVYGAFAVITIFLLWIYLS